MIHVCLPIGSYQTVFGTNSTMTACMVDSAGQCKESWDVEVMSCGVFNMVYLVPTTSCGRYCMGTYRDNKCMYK